VGLERDDNGGRIYLNTCPACDEDLANGGGAKKNHLLNCDEYLSNIEERMGWDLDDVRERVAREKSENPKVRAD